MISVVPIGPQAARMAYQNIKKMSPSATTIHFAITIPNLPSSLAHWPNTLGAHMLPTPCETNYIRRAIEKADTDVALIDQEITRLNEVLAHAKLRRAEICRHGEAHKALLAPVLRCPNEILSEIFIYWSHEERHQNEMPWRTGSICRRWREIALSASALWSDIKIVHRDGERRRGVQRHEMLLELFRRTGVSRPISLQILSLHSSLSEFTKDILSIILPTSNRWINLCLFLSNSKIKSFSPIKGAISSLESIKIQGGMLDKTCDVFEVAPRLFRVKLPGLCGGDITLPWTQLTDVSLGKGCSFELCLTILSDCPNLVSCAFDGVTRCIAKTSRFRNSVLHHAHLRNLKPETHVDPSAFFDRLSTPELRTYHIDDKVRDVFDTSVVNFLLRSSCRIVTLKLDGFIHSIGRVIRFMPELEELQVTRKCRAKLACKLLLDLTLNTSVDENSNLCPRLHTIHLYSEKGIDKHVFLEFIKSRRPMLVLNQPTSKCQVNNGDPRIRRGILGGIGGFAGRENRY